MAYPDFEPFELTVVSDGDRRVPLARALKVHLPDWTWSQVRGLCKSGRVTVDGRAVYDARRQVDPGARVVVAHRPSDERLASVWADFRIIAEDAHLVVVHKPAGISTVPHEAGSRLTVQDLIKRTWRARGSGRQAIELFVVHRLPADVSGLLVLARDPHARASLFGQLRTRVSHPEFIAVVHGRLERDRFTIRTRIAADRGDGVRGSVRPPRIGKEAITHVEVLERLQKATVVRCAVETNRTHQVRIHLAEIGHPVLGETQYLDGYEGTKLPAPRIALHASRLTFRHPHTGRVMRYFAPPPADLSQLVSELGGNPGRLTGWGGRHRGRIQPNNPRLREWWQGADAPRRGRSVGRPPSPPTRRQQHPETPPPRAARPSSDGAKAGTKLPERAPERSPERIPERAPARPRRRVRPKKTSEAEARKERARKIEQLKAEIEALAANPPLPGSKRRKKS